MDYDFSRLSTRSFEQMVQSLALASMGGGVDVFGDGPDGGREATFEGLQSYPDSVAPWTGYGVIQAKFRQKPGVKDGAWAVKELKEELDKLVKSSVRRPEYYVFVTNVILTPVATSGGKDKVTATLVTYKKLLGIKDFRVWDRDQLCALLDTCTDVRTAYQAWITPGDVLAAVLEHMSPKNRDFREIMLNFVQKELRGEQYVNLGQAGHSGKDRIQLASVFVDLPVEEASFKTGFTTGSRGHSNDEKDTVGVINALITVAGQKLDPESVSRKQSLLVHPGTSKPPGKFVFIGGPGQGKSTLTQFFCQLHRSAFIEQHSRVIVTEEIREACKVILEQCTEELISPPKLARFPLRIELNKFAAALANQKCSSLFNYILNRIKERSERDLKSEDLRKWLSNYPWILALDGLDEVPASSNRAEVLSSIQDFLIDANDCNADLLLIATSRPQGYDDDFSDINYNHYRLCELKPDQALHYAKRLIVRKCGDDLDKINTLINRMARASEEPATIRLMKSPLQVTIMALLVESLGEPPKERWRLFNEYYQVINRREKERDIPAAKLLNSFQADIDFIHQKVGANLQIKSERSGGTEALLSESEFSEIIIHRLNEEGHTGEKGEQFKNDVIEAALQRLVFLVAPQEGSIGFEIRSLQEFMAAQYISTGTDSDVSNRLKSIAHAAHWRNVFLFAAGRCFHERQHLRDSIFSICSQLNDGMESGLSYSINKVILTGSEVALDILDDGAIANQPAQLRIFTRIAIRLVELPPCEEQYRLAAVYQHELKDVYYDAIEARLNKPNEDERFGAWNLLLELVNRGIDWSLDLTKNYWPKSPNDIIRVGTNGSITSSRSQWVVNQWFDAVLSSNPSETSLHLIPGIGADQENFFLEHVITPAWFKLIVSSVSSPHVAKIDIQKVSKAVKLHARSITSSTLDLVDASACQQPVWRWILRATIFSHKPTKLMLAELLEDAADIFDMNDTFPIGNWEWTLTWQLSTFIKRAKNGDDFRKYSELVRNGHAGDEAEWDRALERWQNSEVSLADLMYVPKQGLPFDQNIGEVGLPCTAFHPVFSAKNDPTEALGDLLNLFSQSLSPEASELIATAIVAIVAELDEDKNYQLPETLFENFLAVCSTAKRDWFDITIINILPQAFWDTKEALTLIKYLAHSPNNYTFEAGDVDVSNIDRLASAPHSMDDAIILLAKLTYVGRELNFLSLPGNLSQHSSASLKLAHITLGICNKYCSTEHARQWAETMIELYENESNGVALLSEFLSSLESRTACTLATERFLYEIYTCSKIMHRQTKSRLIYLLKEHQKYHLSSDPDLLS